MNKHHSIALCFPFKTLVRLAACLTLLFVARAENPESAAPVGDKPPATSASKSQQRTRPEPHASGNIRHPAYDASKNRQGCPANVRSSPGKPALGMRDCFRLLDKLQPTHPHWSASVGLEVTHDGASVWVAELYGAQKDHPERRSVKDAVFLGKIHVLAVDHPVYGRAGTILLDTVAESPPPAPVSD